MKVAKIHPQETSRLKVLKQLKLLDSPPESEYDTIVQLAADICETPMAFISVVDQDRQWFKSKIGLDFTQTPKEVSFCAHALLEDDVFIIEDASIDNRFFDNPLVKDNPKIIFYAGAVFTDPVSHLPLGTLCVIDHKPRHLSPLQKKSLRTLAFQISQLLRIRLKRSLIQDQQLEINLLHEALNKSQIGFSLRKRNHDENEIQEVWSNEIFKDHLPLNDVFSTQMERSTPKHLPYWDLVSTPSELKTAIFTFDEKGEKWIAMSSQLLKGLRGESVFFLTTTIDVSEQIHLQHKMSEQAKYVSIAEMSAGVAHEINNPLAVIAGNASILSVMLDKLEKSHKLNHEDAKFLKDKCEKVNVMSQRISSIVKGLKTLSRDGHEETLQSVNLFECIEEVLVLCQEKTKIQSIVIKNSIPKNFMVSVKPIQFSQVLVNLLNNAIQAIEFQPQKWIHFALSSNDGEICLRVIDCGKGIPQKISERLFEPFFTTKEIGKGTGLGLSLSKTFMMKMGSDLTYELFEGHTSFKMKLAHSSEDRSDVKSR
jgi:two-component system NtrC family sensor kinase